MSLAPLASKKLYTHCDPESFSFETTNDLQEEGEFIGQGRAIEAIRFAIGMQHKGYNLYVMGPQGGGMHHMVDRHFNNAASQQGPPPEWAYVNNFDTPHQPKMLRFPEGMAFEFSEDMTDLIELVQTTLNAMFESDEYQNRRQEVEDDLSESEELAMESIQEEARAKKIAMVRTPNGLAFAPTREGEIISPEEFQTLEEEKQDEIEDIIKTLQEKLQHILQQRPRLQRELKEQVKKLDREMTSIAIDQPFKDMLADYDHHQGLKNYLEAVREDILNNLSKFMPDNDNNINPLFTSPKSDEDFTQRYDVNVIVDHDPEADAPVIYENNPTYNNLMGRVEYIAKMGALTTNFMQIKAGALHRANGGYLILDAHSLLLQPFAWEGLKRALQSSEIRIETPAQMSGTISTTSLEPEPIPLNVKVAIIGSRQIYYQLKALDPDFGEMFKVAADFEEVIERTSSTELAYARQIATLVDVAGLKPFDRSAVARVIERGARLASDSQRLTINTQQVTDLLREADYWSANADVVSAEHVQTAIDAAIHRVDRMRERSLETIERDIIMIDTEGEAVGQVNALSVLQLGDFAFGRPSRITANVRLGSGKVIDIEREVDLSGPLHSKGVLILTGFLGERYATDKPLSFAASLVFEQSYGGVDGDSASSTELYALLSALSGVPIKQQYAVTGSVNQKGQVQAIGGVNEKIEGFFDVCLARGLTGDQGVLIPEANVVHLMLRQDVVKAVEEGTFHIYAVQTIDQGIEILTGVEAGNLHEDGTYPEGTINALVKARIAELAEQRLRFKGGENNE